jgi:TonB-linked SusC/RagA family outer membrane protein
MFLLVLFMATAAFSQQKKVTLSLKNVTVKTALEALKAQSGLSYWINANDVDMQKVISVNLKSKTVEGALKAILQGQDVRYQLSGDHIVISKATRVVEPKQEKAAPSGEMRQLTGKVTDEKGQALPGVTVVIQGTTKGTISDANGNYSLQNVSPNETLEFSFVGMVSQEIKVANQHYINVNMNEEVIGLNEIVAVGYQTEKKADLTGAVSVVNVAPLAEASASNPMQDLQGKIAGVNITNDGSPSGGTVIRIRGIGTLNDNDPLYVIDGVPTMNGLQVLNPNDIESIQVLKDAASASIYGSRAANGVIIVTTKKATQGQLKVSANVKTTYEWYGDIEPVLNAQQYGLAMYTADVNDGIDPNTNSYSYHFNWNGNYATPVLNSQSIVNYPANVVPANTNWFKAISQLSTNTDYNVSVANGSDKGHSMFFLDYMDNNGIIKTTNLKRFTGRLNTDYNLLNNKLVIGENLSMNTTTEVDDAEGSEGYAFLALPIVPIHTTDGGWGGPWGGMNDRQNPVRLLTDNVQNRPENLYVFGNMYADLEIIKDLHLKTSFGIDYNSYDYRDMQLAYVSGFLNNPNNSVQNNHSTSDKWTWSNTLSYKFNKGKHSLDALLGTEAYEETDQNFWANALGFASSDPNYMYLDAATGVKNLGGNAATNTLLSYFGKVDYVFDNKYLASATVRYDGSSKFGTNNQFGTFPAFSLGWRINDEKFMKDFTKLSDLKLRASWGETGNQNIANGATVTEYATNYTGGDPTWGTAYGTAYDLEGAKSGNLPSGFVKTQIGNPNLKWETTTQTNIGLDFGFFNQALSGSFDYYVKDTKNILVEPPYIGALGEGGYEWLNGAGMQNKGMEFSISYTGKIGHIKYDVSGNISGYRNKVTYLPESVINNYGGNGTTETILGHPIGSLFGYVAQGLFTSTTQWANAPTQPNLNASNCLGRIRYKDINGDGKIDTNDQAWIFNPTPSFSYGINIKLGYKDFDMTLYFQGLGKTQIENNLKVGTDFWSIDDTGSNKGSRLLGAWSPTNPNSTIPALAATDFNDEARFSTYYIEDGAYLKLRNVEIGYNLPKTLAEKFHVSNLRLYVAGQNLLHIYAKSFTGQDPEDTSYGYPIPEQVTGGLSVSF